MREFFSFIIHAIGIFTAFYWLSACTRKENTENKDFRPLIYLSDVHQDADLYAADSLLFIGDTESAYKAFESVRSNLRSGYAEYKMLVCLTELGRQNESDSLFNIIKERTEQDSIIIFFRNLALEDYFFRFYPQKCDVKRMESLKSLSINNYYHSLLHNKIGRYYLNINFQMDSAWQYYQSAWAKRSAFNTMTDAQTLTALSEICTYKRKNLLAIGYANRMADFGQYYFESRDKLKCEAFTNRAFMLFRDGDMTGSMADLEEAIMLSDSVRYPDVHQEVLKAGIILNMIKGDSAAIHRFHSRLQKAITDAGKDYVNIFRFSGRLAEESGRTSEAIELMQKALLYESDSGYDRKAVVSNLSHLLSYAYENRKEYSKALDMMAKSRSAGDRFELEKFLQLVRSENQYSFVPALRSAEIYFHKYEDEKIMQDLLNAERLITVIDSLMPAQWNVGEENAILQFYLETGADFYKLAIRIYFELYNKTGNTRWEDLFFIFCEKNKNSLLVRDYLMARKYASIPEKWLQKERNLKTKIKEAQLKGLRNNMAFVRIIEDYEELEKILEKDFQGFVENPLISQDISKTEMQNKLTEDQTLLHFNAAEEHLYIGLLTKTSSHIYTIPYDASLLNAMDSLVAFHKSQVFLNEDAYQKISYRIFTKLFDPKAQKMLKNQWLVIPDGNLFSFPLAALVTDTVKKPSGMEDLPLVLHKYQLNYIPAVRIVNNAGPRKEWDPESIAVFAFSDKSTILAQQNNRMSELPGTYTEARKLEKLYPGARIYTGTKATKENFMKMYSDPSVRYIHLAIHGLANSNVRDDVKLYFRTVTGGVDSLYGYELLTLSSKVEKVVLSACQSGLGSYQKGEGTYSLPRYFIINGATDVTASLWDLDDRFDPSKPNVGLVRWGW